MKGCLDEDRLLALMLTEPGDDPTGRAHLTRCRTCTIAYRELATDTKVIAQTLNATARAVMATPARPVSHARGEQGCRFRHRRILMTGSVAACAGALAAALLLMLPAVRRQIHSNNSRSAVMTMASNTAVATRVSADTVVGSGDTITSAESPYMLWQPYQSEVIITDPTEDIGYHEALAGTSTYQDLFFCVPQSDDEGNTVCASSADQG